MERSKRKRCTWAGTDPLYVAYHDEEWGVPVHDDRVLFEFLVLEGAQAGLSWITILRKREAYRRAFDRFDARKVARYDERKVEALLADAGIVRNRAKIEAAIRNARAALDLPSGLAELVWAHAPDAAARPVPQTLEEVPAATAESKALSRELKRHGFAFTGPVTVYSTMQACGLVDDHLAGCFRRGAYR